MGTVSLVAAGSLAPVSFVAGVTESGSDFCSGLTIDSAASFPSDHIIRRSLLRSSSFPLNFSANISPTPLITSSTEFNPLSTRTNSVARVAISTSGEFACKISSASGSNPCCLAKAARDCFWGLKGRYKSSSRRLVVAFFICNARSSERLPCESIDFRTNVFLSASARSCPTLCLIAKTCCSLSPPVKSFRKRVTNGIVFPASSNSTVFAIFSGGSFKSRATMEKSIFKGSPNWSSPCVGSSGNLLIHKKSQKWHVCH